MLTHVGLSHFSGEMNFTFKIEGGGDEILASAGSTSADGNYVFSVDPMLLIPETGKIFCVWGVSGKTDTMISIWNSGNEAEDAEMLLTYEGGKYRLPVHLEAHGSLSINLGSLIRSGTPDASGNVIPSSVIQGAAQLVNPHGRRTPMDIHAHASVFNVETATCLEVCPECDSIIYVIATPSGVTSPAGTIQYHTTATSKTDGSYDVTTRTTWGSSNTGIATIVSSGTQSGFATGHNYGAATMTGNYRDTGVPPWQEGALCQYGKQCPVYVGNPTAPINVGKTIRLNTSDCSSKAPDGSVTFTADWGDAPLGGCQLADAVNIHYPAADGGVCNPSGTTNFGNARNCWVVNKNGCQTSELPYQYASRKQFV